MEKEPRYVVRREIGRCVYWYWQRKGFKTERLPDDPAKRRHRAEALNSVAEAGTMFEPGGYLPRHQHQSLRDAP